MMLGITRLTRSGRLREATAAIQRALGRHPPAPVPPAVEAMAESDVIDVEARFVVDDEVLAPEAVDAPEAVNAPEAPEAVEVEVSEPAAPARGAGEFTSGSFENAAGMRPYRLFVPGSPAAAPRPLVVMLHGCKQNPDDFAAGTRMNELAQAQDVVVLYPGQVARVNQLGCWNWFKQQDQQRGQGEPSLIADMTRHIIDTQGIDPARVYIAGLSAGGAMSAVMAATYPELYAAVGIHSGLPHAAAHNLATALAAMRHGPAARRGAAAPADRVPVPTIVFHGDLDTTVHPDNGEEVIAQARWGSAARADDSNGSGMTVEQARTDGGHAYTRTLHRDGEGRCDAEHWLVHGCGHAWSGGSTQGSYTDPLGPDASAQMLRFFLEHPRPRGG